MSRPLSPPLTPLTLCAPPPCQTSVTAARAFIPPGDAIVVHPEQENDDSATTANITPFTIAAAAVAASSGAAKPQPAARPHSFSASPGVASMHTLATTKTLLSSSLQQRFERRRHSRSEDDRHPRPQEIYDRPLEKSERPDDERDVSKRLPQAQDGGRWGDCGVSSPTMPPLPPSPSPAPTAIDGGAVVDGSRITLDQMFADVEEDSDERNTCASDLPASLACEEGVSDGVITQGKGGGGAGGERPGAVGGVAIGKAGVVGADEAVVGLARRGTDPELLVADREACRVLEGGGERRSSEDSSRFGVTSLCAAYYGEILVTC